MSPVPATESRWLDVRGRRLHVHAVGVGPPLVLLHGGGADASLISWGRIVELLADRFRLYLPDWPGYGRSEPWSDTLRSEDLPHVVERIRTHLELDRLDLVGVSLGGLAALSYALEYPDRLRRAAVFGCGGLQDRAPYHRVARFALQGPQGAALARLQWRNLGRSSRLLRASLKSLLPTFASVPDDLVRMVQDELNARPDPTVFFRWQRDELGPRGLKTDLSGRVGAITAPVLMLHGTKDMAVPVAYARAAAERLPNGRYVEFVGGGHWLPREAPEASAERLAAFFGATDPEPGFERVVLDPR